MKSNIQRSKLIKRAFHAFVVPVLCVE